MAGQNTLIIASDYNIIQNKIALVMGSGTGTSGYGQSLSSSQVGQYSKVTIAQWTNLRNDLIRARQHQLGETIGSRTPEDVNWPAYTDPSDLRNVPIPTQDTMVKETWRKVYADMAIACETNQLVAPPPASQATRSSLVPQKTRTTPWNSRIKQTVTVTWATADEARYFFNTGGQIEFSASRSGGTAGLKNVTWSTMLNTMGTIIFNYDTTITTGTGEPQPIGFYDLDIEDNFIFEKDAPLGAYAPNKYFIYARVNSTSDRKEIVFTIYFADDSLAPPSTPDPGFGVDEQVDGTLISNVAVYRATGDNVSRPVPSATSTEIA
jgi:hypothetical protein